MHTDQVRITEDLARDLVRNQFPQFEDAEIFELRTAGTVNAIFRIGAAHTARFPLRRMSPGQCRRLLEAEVRAMTELATVCRHQVPQPIGIGKQCTTFPMPWLVQTWVAGEPATPDALSGSPTFARDLAFLVRSFRMADLEGRTFDGRGRGGELPAHDDWMEICFAKSEDILDVPRLRRFWSRSRELPSPGYEAMSHKDLIPANLLVQGERLVGVLDGGAFGPADPSLDLIAGWHFLDRVRRDLFRDAVEANELEWNRGAAWAFLQSMGLVWYYRETNPTMSALGHSTICRLLQDHTV